MAIFLKLSKRTYLKSRLREDATSEASHTDVYYVSLAAFSATWAQIQSFKHNPERIRQADHLIINLLLKPSL